MFGGGCETGACHTQAHGVDHKRVAHPFVGFRSHFPVPLPPKVTRLVCLKRDLSPNINRFTCTATTEMRQRVTTKLIKIVASKDDC